MNIVREIGRNFYCGECVRRFFYYILPFNMVSNATSHRFSSVKYEILLSFIALKP